MTQKLSKIGESGYECTVRKIARFISLSFFPGDRGGRLLCGVHQQSWKAGLK